jgi:hypothetical protein
MGNINFVVIVPAKPSTPCDAVKASQCLVKRELASESAVTNNQTNNLELHLNLQSHREDGSKFLLRSNLPKRLKLNQSPLNPLLAGSLATKHRPLEKDPPRLKTSLRDISNKRHKRLDRLALQSSVIRWNVDQVLAEELVGLVPFHFFNLLYHIISSLYLT